VLTSGCARADARIRASTSCSQVAPALLTLVHLPCPRCQPSSVVECMEPYNGVYTHIESVLRLIHSSNLERSIASKIPLIPLPALVAARLVTGGVEWVWCLLELIAKAMTPHPLGSGGPHANSFVIGTAVTSNKHTGSLGLREGNWARSHIYNGSWCINIGR
jgi:hypothetical protein